MHSGDQNPQQASDLPQNPPQMHHQSEEDVSRLTNEAVGDEYSPFTAHLLLKTPTEEPLEPGAPVAVDPLDLSDSHRQRNVNLRRQSEDLGAPPAATCSPGLSPPLQHALCNAPMMVLCLDRSEYDDSSRSPQTAAAASPLQISLVRSSDPRSSENEDDTNVRLT